MIYLDSSALVKLAVVEPESEALRGWLAERAELLATAASLQPPDLRSLDAIHLASALFLRNRLTAFVGYDDRLNLAVRAAGLPVAVPSA